MGEGLETRLPGGWDCCVAFMNTRLLCPGRDTRDEEGFFRSEFFRQRGMRGQEARCTTAVDLEEKGDYFHRAARTISYGEQ